MRDLFRRQPKFRPHDDDDQSARVPGDLWVKCPKCEELAYTREHRNANQVCQACNYHFRISAADRINLLADVDSFEEWDAQLSTADPLQFRVGNESYADKARATSENSGIPESVVSGVITIEQQPVAVVVTDFKFMGASMGSVYGEKLVRAVERAIELQMPVLTISSSGGARMQEGLFSLMQMSKTTSAFIELGSYRLPHFSLLVDPCYGGVTASYATTADIILAEPGARIGFAGPRVIEQVTRQKLPEGFQTSEFLLQHGMIDMVVPRDQLRTRLATLMSIYRPARKRTRTKSQSAHQQAENQAVPSGAAIDD